MSRRIAIYSGSRADANPLGPVIRELSAYPDCDLHQIDTEGLYGHEERIRSDLERIRPYLLVLLGDTYQTLVAASVAAEMTIPIAHIGGGEETLGAVDEQFRHAITKLSYWHFTAHSDFAKRVIGMGESPERVFVTGDPQVDSLALCPQEEITVGHPCALVCYNPETLGSDTINMAQILKLLPKYKSVFIAGANADKGGDTVNRIWHQFMRPNFFFNPGFPHGTWINLMRQADTLIGNSSSFAIEAMTMGKKIIMIGDRQKGRWEHAQQAFRQDPHAYGKPGEVGKAIAEKLMNVVIPHKPRKAFHEAR